MTVSDRGRSVLVLALLCVALGLVLRFTNLGARAYTNDEATTSIRVAGSSLAEWDTLQDGRERTVAELRRYQTLVPGRTVADTVRALAAEDPQHPPLYYVLERGWVQLAGDGVAQRRALSAIFGALAILAAFLLGVEGGGTLLAGGIFAALVAVSPFHVIYAQQAREYSLWGFLVLLSTWLLLRALRRGTAAGWVWYALALSAGFYTDLLFLVTLVAHAAIVAAVGRPLRRAVLAWSAAGAGALIAFVPWLVAVVHGAAILTNNNYLGARLPLVVYVSKWLFNASAVFVDLQYGHPAALVLLPVLALVLIAVVAASAGRIPRPALAAGVALAGVTIAAMIAYDALHHESRSTAARYIVPGWIGIELIVASAVAALAGSASRAARARGALAFGFVALLGAASIVAENGTTWTWADSSAAGLPVIAKAINATPNAVVVFKPEGTQWDFTAAQLLNTLHDDVRIRMEPGGSRLALSGAGTTYLLDPTAATREEARRTGRAVEQVYVQEDMTTGLTRLFRSRAKNVRKDEGISDGLISLWRVGG